MKMFSNIYFVSIICYGMIIVFLGGCMGHIDDLLPYKIVSGGKVRTYWLYIPKSLPTQRVPLVLALHRFVETGPDMAYITQFNKVADTHKFIVAYPEGILRAWNGFSRWENDVQFLKNVVRDISQKTNIDPSHVYIVGASSGGYMALRAAIEAPEVFAAAAVVMATMPSSVAETDVPSLPVLFIHGTDDPIIPYDESRVYAGPGRTLEVYNVPQTINFWVARNNCLPEPLRESLPDLDPTDGTTTERETYFTQDGEPRVVLYKVKNGGHTWPGGKERWPNFIVGQQSKDFSASEVIWDFFKRWN